MKKLFWTMLLSLSLLLVACGSESEGNGKHKHAYTEEVTTAATCENEGVKTFTCDCGDTYTEAITALGHTFENYTSNNDATYVADGTETGVCACGATDTRTVAGSKLEYTYTDMSATKYAKEEVNVRDLPSTSGNKIGRLPFAQKVVITGQCVETGWYRVEYEGGVAYISNHYLVEKDPTPQVSDNGTVAPLESISASMENALFIGDSRTEGIRLYTKDLTGAADFFSETSASMGGVVSGTKYTFNAGTKYTISEVLTQRRYDKVYIMLGINEAGKGATEIANSTKKLISLIQEKQPGTPIFIMGNLYVSTSYQEGRPAFSTTNMKAINSAQAALANNTDVFYLDANFMFVDADGNLSMEYSGDGCHLKSKEYTRWVQWITAQTISLLGL